MNNSLAFNDYGYKDFESIKCVKDGLNRKYVKSLHDGNFLSLNFLNEVNYTNENLKNLQGSLLKAISERLNSYNRIVCQSFIVFLKAPNPFGLMATLKNIDESLHYMELVVEIDTGYRNFVFVEIPNYYLTCVKIISFFDEILLSFNEYENIKEDFKKIKTFGIRDLKTYSCIHRYSEDFDSNFGKALNDGKMLFKLFSESNFSELRILLEDL